MKAKIKVNQKLLEVVKYDQEGLIPAVVQDVTSGQVLMLAYMNETSLSQTLQTGQTCFYSRSRKKLWVKGESSGHTQKVKQISLDCDGDTLLIKVEQKGVACHTGAYSCFYRNVVEDTINESCPEKYPQAENLFAELTQVFEERKKNPRPDSYVCRLWASPGEKMPKKIVEEAAEVIIALKDEDRKQIVYEVADLWFHTLVALFYHGICFQEIMDELKSRRK